MTAAERTLSLFWIALGLGGAGISPRRTARSAVIRRLGNAVAVAAEIDKLAKRERDFFIRTGRLKN